MMNAGGYPPNAGYNQQAMYNQQQQPPMYAQQPPQYTTDDKANLVKSEVIWRSWNIYQYYPNCKITDSVFFPTD